MFRNLEEQNISSRSMQNADTDTFAVYLLHIFSNSQDTDQLNTKLSTS
jgi:hypothetical protein